MSDLTAERSRICAEACGFKDCSKCTRSQRDCEISLAHVKIIMQKQYYCVLNRGYEDDIRTINPLKHHKYCRLSKSNITCMQCSYRRELRSRNKR
jgi:hypothetical protein